MTYRALGLAAILVGLGFGPGLRAQDTPPDSGRTTLDSVYSTDQAYKGQQVYREQCTACHAPTSYTGSAFRRVWGGRSVFDFFDLVRTTMPNDNPGKLSRGDYAAIMAYLLKLNGLPSGERPLPEEDEELKKIRIEVPPPDSGSRQ
jgi:mono/diheme cytochrome c family protein